MPPEEFGHQRDAPLRRNVREADQSRVPNVMQPDELPEVGVDGDQNPVFGPRTFKQRFVARVGAEGARFQNVVPLFAQPSGEPSAGAPVDEKSHGPDTATADSVSPAMTACA